VALASHHEFAPARNAYYAALTIDPNLLPAYNNLGILEYALRDYGAAEYWYRKLVKIAPENYATWYNLGLVYLAQQRKDDALHVFQSAWNSGHSADAGNELGLMLLDEGNLTEAVHLFSAIIEAQKNYLPAWYNLGLAYQRLGNRTESRRWFEAYAATVTDPRERSTVNALLKKL
jgi:tetratricopeptide (TPR) repeat protein